MKKIIVVGNGMVGYKFCEKMVAKAPKGSCHITVLAEERRPAYDRVHLTSYINGISAEALTMAPISWYESQNIDLHLGDAAVNIDRQAKTIRTESGAQWSYDILVLATGSAAMVPPIHGVEKKGVFVYRTIDDLDKIIDYASGVKKVAVLGGGLLGLEAAKAMVDIGIEKTYVIEFAPKLMPRQLDDTGGAVLRSKLTALGLKVHTRKHTYQVLGEEKVTGIQFVDESELSVEMLVISTGINARDELASAAGLTTGPRGGIVVNDSMVTADSSIYAIGECAVHEGIVYGLVAPGYDMAEVATTHIIANYLDGERKQRSFTGFDMSTKLKLIGVDVASFGDPFLTADKAQHLIYEDKVHGIYKRLNISLDGKYLLGGVMVGEASKYNNLLQYYKNNMPLPEALDTLVFPEQSSDKQPAGAGLDALPDGALICSCEGVTKRDICQAVDQGYETADAVKKCTKAGTGCGGCMPIVKDLVTMTLKNNGKEVRSEICEHFPYSRQQLYDLIKLERLSSFEQVLKTHGSGDGCEVCKPVISSLVASILNEMILSKNKDTAQDSNDRFLANIQKGGSYSVVPRIPGGEITPDKLLVIATVAKKYNLYTKITGGQRIDMFGAHLSELPLIWKELIDAGFESGHAYGKSLRTVKSCVGSTWCRFGLHDSVSFAIRIENRYKGLRTPHKIKSAVSGCIRECAEAQSKDFGIIATEKGWNLYVCGNGGSKPQHALLLAQDLDSDTCIRYIDRFLMYYIKTADPLTRTATWLNKLEGGIDYLRKVVVEDSLGKAAEWEAEMQAVLDQYACEWKVAVEDPAIRKRFAHFVNAPEQNDPTIAFVPLREQKRVAEW